MVAAINSIKFASIDKSTGTLFDTLEVKVKRILTKPKSNTTKKIEWDDLMSILMYRQLDTIVHSVNYKTHDQRRLISNQTTTVLNIIASRLRVGNKDYANLRINVFVNMQFTAHIDVKNTKTDD